MAALPKSTEYSSPYFTFTIEDSVANATAELADGSTGTFYTLYVDNTANTGTQVYVKLYNDDDETAITIGSTAPNYIFPVAGGKTKHFLFPDGFAYNHGLTVACVTSGGTEGTTAPTSAVIVRIGVTT